MFIKTGKSLFGNTGLIVALIILCVLLYLSYNKCYVGNSIENFYSPPNLPNKFTINYKNSDNSYSPWLYNSANDTVNLTTGSPIILSVFNDTSVYNNSLGAVGLQNNNDPSNLSYIRHANYILHSNAFAANNYDFGWVFNPVNVNSDGSETYTIGNYFRLPSKYYIGIDNNRNVLITTNTPIVNWAIKEYLEPDTTSAITMTTTPYVTTTTPYVPTHAPTPEPTPSPTLSNTPPPNNVRAKISGGTITVNFTIDNSPQNKVPIQFVIVLGQYDSNKKNTGNNKFILSNETEINASVILNSKNTNTNMCTLNNGLPVCQYIFNNIDVRDSSNNLYYYKIGVSAVYLINSVNYNTPFVMPYNISSPDNMFTLDSSAEQQSKSYSDFLAYQKGQSKQVSANVYDSTIATADGQYELIKSQLGNYPDNLLLDNQTVNQGTLNDLLDKTMAQAILNVNIR